MFGERARLEETVARAHRAIYHAAESARSQGLHGTADDLDLLLVEVSRVGKALIDRRNPKAVLGFPPELPSARVRH